MNIKWASVGDTYDDTYVLRLFFNIFLSKKLKLYCCFIDYTKAIDSVWRDDLCLKLVKSGIEKKLFHIMKNMYLEMKSCVFLNGTNFLCFTQHEGIKQGENLLPFLFSLIINHNEVFVL